MLEKIKPFSIDLLEDNSSFDVVDRLYRRALLNCLINLKPTNCLEIGTFQRESARVFSYYFNKYVIGKLITLDISLWNNIENDIPGVHPLMVYPHSLDIESRHGEIKIYHSDWRSKLESGGNSVLINGEMVNRKMEDLDIESFDFAFIDGDHSRHSVYSDLYTALPLMNPEGYLLFDDVFDEHHEFYFLYKELRRKNNFYEFSEWNPNPGIALIKVKDFIWRLHYE